MADGIKNDASGKQSKDKKNKGGGCLLLIIIIILAGYFAGNDKDSKTTSDYFPFDENQFVNIFSSKLNGKTISRRRDSNKETGIYELNNQFSFLVLHKNNKNEKVKSACIVFENDEKYRDDDSIVLSYFQSLLLSFVDLGYLNQNQLPQYLSYIQNYVFDKSIAQRKELEYKNWKFTKNEDGKQVPYFSLELAAGGPTGDFCVSAR